MERDRRERIEQPYHAALERGPDAREAILDKACAGDEAFRREVAWLVLRQKTIQPVFSISSLGRSPFIPVAQSIDFSNHDH
jgi:hypothetical protein